MERNHLITGFQLANIWSTNPRIARLGRTGPCSGRSASHPARLTGTIPVRSTTPSFPVSIEEGIAVEGLGLPDAGRQEHPDAPPMDALQQRDVA